MKRGRKKKRQEPETDGKGKERKVVEYVQSVGKKHTSNIKFKFDTSGRKEREEERIEERKEERRLHSYYSSQKLEHFWKRKF